MNSLDIDEWELLGNRTSILLSKVENMINNFQVSSKTNLLSYLEEKIISKIDKLKDKLLVQFRIEAAAMESNLWKDKLNLLRIQQRLENENGTLTSKDRIFMIKDQISKIRENLDIRLDVKLSEHVSEIEKCGSLGTVSFVRTPKQNSSPFGKWLCAIDEKRNQNENQNIHYPVIHQTSVNLKTPNESPLPSDGRLLKHGGHTVGIVKMLSTESSGFIEITGPSNQSCGTNNDSGNVAGKRIEAQAGILNKPTEHRQSLKLLYDLRRYQESKKQTVKPDVLHTRNEHGFNKSQGEVGVRIPAFEVVRHVPTSDLDNSKMSALNSVHKRNVKNGDKSYKFLKSDPSARSGITNKGTRTRRSYIEIVGNDNIRTNKVNEKEVPSTKVNRSIGGNKMQKRNGTVHSHFVHDVIPKRSLDKHDIFYELRKLRYGYHA